MIRLVVFFVLVLAIGFGFSWLADRPGDLTLVWGGELYQTKLIVAAALLLGIIAIVMIAWWLVRLIWTSPQSVSRYFRGRKRDRGYQALSTGLIAAGTGNAILARKMAARSRGLLRVDQEPLIHLLEAQAALIEGKHDEARVKFEEMSQDPETRELGLRGLYVEAKRLGASEAARQYAEQAADKAPYLQWAAQATLEYRSQAGRWDEALQLLDQQKAAHVFDKDETNRMRAVLLTARAGEKLEADPAGARDDALHALKLAHDFVPAALIAAKALFRLEKFNKAISTLEQVWKILPHPEIGRAYVRARSGDSVLDRLKRAEKLEAMRPNNIESLLITAQAALDAGKYDLARSKAESAARMEDREGIFLLLADIEDAETGDQGRMRHWMAQALRAPRDPAWVADGFVSEKWLPVSPVSGKLGAFEWRRPFGQVEGPVEQGSLVDDALRTLPQPARVEKPAEPPIAAPVVELAAPAKPVPMETMIKPEPVIEKTPEPTVRKTVSDAPKDDAKQPNPEPFFGGRPDDPGVRSKRQSEEDTKTRLRLF